MNQEEAAHSVVRKNQNNAQYSEVPAQININPRATQKNSYTGIINGNAAATFMLPLHNLLYSLKVLNSAGRITSQIHIHRIEIQMTLLPQWQSTLPENYVDPLGDSGGKKNENTYTFTQYYANKILDGRMRMVAVVPKKMLSTIPHNENYPFYSAGTSGLNVSPPLIQNASNDYGLCETIDPRNYHIIYDDVKDMYRHKSSSPNFALYQDIIVDTVYEYDNVTLLDAELEYHQDGIFQRIPQVWFFMPPQPLATATIYPRWRYNIDVRMVYDNKVSQ